MFDFKIASHGTSCPKVWLLNALGKQSDLLTAHPIYLSINEDAKLRQAAYRALFTHHVEPTLIEDIRKATNKGLALGSESFKLRVQALSGRSVVERKRGRPVGWKKEGN